MVMTIITIMLLTIVEIILCITLIIFSIVALYKLLSKIINWAFKNKENK